MWKNIRSLLFKFDPETVHHLAMRSLTLKANAFGPQKELQVSSKTLFGITFPNILGLAAGFDKNAECLHAWQTLGFGYVEVGTVTALEQPGNPRPRLFRLSEDFALINRMGFNNLGAVKVAANVERQKKHHKFKIPVGINIGKSKVTPLREAPKDYLKSFITLADLADYVVVNVSSPNTPGLRKLQETSALNRLLEVLASANQQRRVVKPLFLKLAPDLSIDEARDCANVAKHFGLKGLIVSNTTLLRKGLRSQSLNEAGGLSGKPLFESSTQMLKQLKTEFTDDFVFIGVGGIFDKESAQKKKQAGADLLQAYTGFIYEGPCFARSVLV